MKRKVVYLFMILALMLSVTPAAFAQDGSLPDRFDGREVPAAIDALKLDSPVSAEGVSLVGLHPSLVGAEGPTRVIVRLHADSVAERNIKGRSAQRMGLILNLYQDRILERVLEIDPSAQVIAQTQMVLNAVFISADGAKLGEIADLPGVARVAPVADFQMDLTETVPYIGGTAVQNMGYDGTGIRVAVLDSGVDYTHANLGGSGDPADYENNDPTVIEPGTFPTAKVVGGYDFVGSTWPDTAEMPDPDPLDDGPQAGHGTHVADIIGGMDGVAPGVDIYAVKVCSSVSTSCSGIALIQGMEFAVDPDGDGDPSDAVDIINMSLGSDYGIPFFDDLSQAVNNATGFGVLTVSSAGNGSNKPYITGTPSSAITALAVAQTNVPSAFSPFLHVDTPEAYAGDYDAVFQPWSVPPTSVISGPMQYGDGDNGNLDGCAPFDAGSLADRIVLVDRGACNFSLKISNISQAGGLAGIIGLIAPGDPFAGGDGGDRPIDIPGYMVSQAVSDVFKAAIAEGGSMTIDPTNGIPLVGTMVGSSSRGPANSDFNLLKPEIGAPGASVSAIAGTGTGTGPFGGTSGASPMVAGSAALLLQANPGLIPAETKARLMNTGETEIYTDMLGMQPAPITRIGGGEVRVDRAVAAPAAAWDDELLLGSLSFGFVDVSKTTVNLFKTVRVRNYSDKDIWYDISSTFRMEDDAATGAVEIEAPKQIIVKAGKDTTFNVKLTIHGELLYGNWMNSGSMGADPSGLDTNEFDGYLMLDDGSGNPIHMAWHVLPRQAAETIVRPGLKFDPSSVAMLNVVNRGVGTAQVDAYSLLALSDNLPSGGPGSQMPVPDLRAVGVQTFPVPAGYCGPEASFLWVFAINSWERQQHLLPVKFFVYLDVDQDGVDDYAILNNDFSIFSTGSFGTISDGRQLALSYDIHAGTVDAFFYAEHAMNTANTALTICGDQIGMNAADMLTTFVNVRVEAFDFYYGGPGDMVDGITITPLGERYFGLFEDVPAKSKTFTYVVDYGKGGNDDLGLLLFTNGDRGAGMRGGATADTEAVIVLPQTPAPKPKP